jgi:hypothetical protein
MLMKSGIAAPRISDFGHNAQFTWNAGNPAFAGR